MNPFHRKTIDAVLKFFQEIIKDLNDISMHKHDEAVEHREESRRLMQMSEEFTQAANLAEGEAGRARKVALNVSTLIAAEKSE